MTGNHSDPKCIERVRKEEEGYRGVRVKNKNGL